MKYDLIDQLEAHLLADPENEQHTRAYFHWIIEFLQRNGLTRRTLLGPGKSLPRKFSLRLRDLTPTGRKFIYNAYDKWLRALDRGTALEKCKILEKELKKLDMQKTSLKKKRNKKKLK